jgi:hypothetical protein
VVVFKPFGFFCKPLNMWISIDIRDKHKYDDSKKTYFRK